MSVRLTDPADLQWLRDTHDVPTDGFTVALLRGNEDCPDRVCLYRNDSWRCDPMVLVPRDERETIGEPNRWRVLRMGEPAGVTVYYPPNVLI